jgi:hypothetical protein
VTLQVDPYKIGSGETELAIFFPYPWGGDRHNNQDILKGVALLTGGLVIGAQTPGTGRLHIDRATRRRLRPGRLADLASDYAGEVNEFLDKNGQTIRLLAAQSGRVALGARMQLSEHRPFTHVLLRDGVNLCAPETLKKGYQRLVSQPPQGEHRHYEDRRKTFRHKMQDRRSAAHRAVEVLTQGKLLCSAESRLAVTALARDITTPLYHLTFEHGITGMPEQQIDFLDELGINRVLGMAQCYGEESTAPFEAAVLPGNHADLQNPLLLHTHINRALNLTGPWQNQADPRP